MQHTTSLALALEARPPLPHGLIRAVDDAERLLLAAHAHATMLAELGDIELPPAARADAMQVRAIASLYLASTLEMAGLIQAADDFTRLMRTGALEGDVGDAAPAIERFWQSRNQRPSEAERLALFGRLFGAPTGPEDVGARANGAFEELLLNLCDALMKAADGGSQGHARQAAIQVAENVSGAASGMVLMLARQILDTLSQAIALLNNAQVRALLHARTLWDAVGAIDRKFRRTPRPTLTLLRRGRAGMAVLAWLAEHVDTIETAGGNLVQPSDPVVDSAVDWVDETLSIVRGQGGTPAAPNPPSAPGGASTSWRDLGS
ncbi:hypothetical protein JMG10_16995 [Nostoc ellipsosporum NOK]|uniref:hypothetical protein n=1 Tax=Sphingomonas sp. IBVSS2 TaxID=1985172 RepID=UPI000A2D559D|nr:hypothetical protein [Sphingomonas sp. IBVSS2]MDF2383183.1 hypothetical protein [Nostoc ellipsosporum NOK]OSZ69511.1 hypothetical protein CAP40_01225 [Sphingomonas sp. IBVSS2]